MDSPVIGCITGTQKFSNGVVSVCVGISIAFITSLVMKFGSGLVGGVFSCDDEFCRNLLSIDSSLNRIDPSTNISSPNPERAYRTKFEILLEGVFQYIIE